MGILTKCIDGQGEADLTIRILQHDKSWGFQTRTGDPDEATKPRKIS